MRRTFLKLLPILVTKMQMDSETLICHADNRVCDPSDTALLINRHSLSFIILIFSRAYFSNAIIVFLYILKKVHQSSMDQVSRNLKNIHEVTDEDQQTAKTQQLKNANNQKQEESDNSESEQTSRNIFQRCLYCLKLLFNRATGKNNDDVQDIAESQISKEISKLRWKKSVIPIVLPPPTSDKITLVLDLDETLIYSEFGKKPKFYDFRAQIPIRGDTPAIVYVTKRYGLDLFLYTLSQHFELVLYSASSPEYIQTILAQIDPKKRISHLLNREQCVQLNKEYFIKDIRMLGRNMERIILIDDNTLGGVLFPQNFYRIDKFYGNPRDRVLPKTMDFLLTLANMQCITPLYPLRRAYQNKKRIPKPPKLNHDLNSQPASQNSKQTTLAPETQGHLWKLRA